MVLVHVTGSAVTSKLFTFSKHFSLPPHIFIDTKCRILPCILSKAVWLNFIMLLAILDLGSSFWGMVLILASTNLLAARIGAGCLVIALIIVLLIAKNVSGFHVYPSHCQDTLLKI